MRGPASKTIVGDLCLEDMGIVVERVHDDPPSARPETVDVPGLDGHAVRAVGYEPRSITLECRVFGERWRDFDRVIDEIAAHAMNHGTVELSVRTHPGETYDAYLTSITQGDRVGGTGIGYMELAFTAPDPYRRGRKQVVTVPSGGSVQFNVGGTAPAQVNIRSAVAVRSSGSTVWGIRFDEGEFVHIPTGSSSSRVVAVDCEKRTATVGSATAMLTLDSDWPELAPGRHVARMDEGTGMATLTWVERSI